MIRFHAMGGGLAANSTLDIKFALKPVKLTPLNLQVLQG